ncbi:MAG: hypothetical protein ACOCRK_06375, partial [bacterium]
MDTGDVLICYSKLFASKDIDKNTAKKVVKYTKELLKRGWKEDQITRRLCMFHKNKGKANIDIIFKKLFKGKKAPFKRENNLLKDKRYYHKELVNTPKKRRNINVRGGYIEIEDPPFYMYNIEIYTLDNLLDYYCNKVNSEYLNNRLKKYNKKVLKNTVSSRDLDLILFTIDYLHKLCKEKSIEFPSSSSKLINYFQEGRQ